MASVRRLSFLVVLAAAALWAQSESPSNPQTEKANSEAKSAEPGSKTEPPTQATPVPPRPNPEDSTRLEPIKTQKAVYPFAAAQQQLQGQVWLKILVSETGDVEKVEVISGDPILAKAAVDAVKKWKFKPFIKNGKAVKISTKVPMDFAFREQVTEKAAPADNDAPSTEKDTTKQDPAESSGSSDNTKVPQRVRISQGVSVGLLLHKVQPVYPEEARRNHVEGTVLLRAMISKDGRISKLEPISGPSELIPAAVGAVQQWRYKPYLLLGQPVEVDTQITVIFQLR